MPFSSSESPAAARPPEGGRLERMLANLRLRLFLLILLAILPALFLVVYTSIETRNEAKGDAIKAGQRVVGLAAAYHKQHIEATRQLLQTIAQLKEIRPEQAAECQALLTNLLAINPVYAGIVAIAPDGRPFARAVPPGDHGDVMDYGAQTWFRDARDSRKFVVGDYRVDLSARRAALDLAQPVLENGTGRLAAVISVAIDLGWVATMAGKLDLVKGSTLTVVDRTGTILVRYSVPESHHNFVGSRVDPRHQSSGPRPSSDAGWVGAGLDGINRLYTATPLSRSGGVGDAFVIFGVPVEVAYAQANRMLTQNLLFLGLVAVLALAAAWIGGDLFVLRHLRALVTAARQMSAGNLRVRSGIPPGPGEVGELAHSFDEMAAALEQRVRELQATEGELKSLNEELERRVLERTAELKRSNEDLEQFAYVASHDLQEPLRMIHNYVNLLRKRYGGQLDTAGHEFIGFALDGAKRMDELIQDLLTYSRVGTHGHDFAHADCQEAFRRALANLSLAIEESRARITHDPLPTVNGDIVQLTQLFQNLIGNALKFRSSRSPEIHVGAKLQGDVWELSVTDNGIGIPPEDFQRIFIVFQRLHSREKYSGTGIGLSVCKKIIERHGGRIWVESKLGKGSSFHFTLPAPAGTVAPAQPPPTAPALALPGPSPVA